MKYLCLVNQAQIEPDTKDWTWVLSQPCPECGLDVQTVAVTDIPRLVRENAAAWWRSLTMPDPQAPPVSQRPTPTTWSRLEYACHVRDVLTLFTDRLAELVAEESPTFADWDQNAAALAGDYGAQDPAVVAQELLVNAERLASAYERLPQSAWHRTGLRSDGAQFTAATLGRYMIHDITHHLNDVQVPRR